MHSTERGQTWLAQFAPEDHATAKRILDSLTLVSHSAFERALTRLIVRQAKGTAGPVALFATRELEPEAQYFEHSEDGRVDAVTRGNDLGSEARVAALIRNLCKSTPGSYLNHPTLEEMRSAHCRAIFVVDDFIGSGKRTSDFLASMWLSSTLRSWHSRGHIQFTALAYSATELGIEHVQAARCQPKIVLYRDCPTFLTLPWAQPLRTEARSLFRRYGKKTSRPGMGLGFRKTMAALVFEHGCPNNAPSILWAPEEASSSWLPLFPDRSVLYGESSAFPPDIVRRDPAAVLRDAGDESLANSEALRRPGALGPTILTVLALINTGMRSRAGIGYATGLPAQECGQILDRCVAEGLLTTTLGLTAAGRAELNDARKHAPDQSRVPPRGSDCYYPKQLRNHVAASARQPKG